MSFAMSVAAAAMAATTGAVPAPWSQSVTHASVSPADSTVLPQLGAVTYDESAVPPRSRIVVRRHRAEGGGTRVGLELAGVQPDRTYGAHVHTKPCGPAPDDSGPHYQHVPDPKQPSTDPAYANPANEVWLDLTTDRHGHGRSESTVDWRFRPGGARSVVVHEHATHTGHGEAGRAGARLACVNVLFA